MQERNGWKWLDLSLSGVERAGIVVGCLALWAIFALIMMQMIDRSVFQRGFSWTDELARYFQIVLVYLGAAWLHRLRGHVSMELFTDSLPWPVQRLLVILIECIIILVCAIILYGGYRLIVQMGHQKSPSLGLPLVWFAAPALIGFALVALEAMRQIILLIFRPDMMQPKGQ